MGSRTRPALAPWLFGPPGICDACGCRCGTLDQVGIACYICGAGVFMHRCFWVFAPCPACNGRRIPCDICRGMGCVATPCADINAAELRDAWQRSINRYTSAGAPLPDAIAQLRMVLDELSG
ncbi:hypothetical protein EIQ18_00610 [Xanthomonas campestris pv. campestris]